MLRWLVGWLVLAVIVVAVFSMHRLHQKRQWLRQPYHLTGRPHRTLSGKYYAVCQCGIKIWGDNLPEVWGRYDHHLRLAMEEEW